jgi:type IV pilus assembly protein PilC
MSPAQRHLLHTELAKLLGAGFGIRQAIAAILDTRPPSAQAVLLKEADQALAEGKSIAQAFGDPARVTDLERTVIAAGERGGRLAQGFQHLADYFEMIASARRDALQSMIYPTVLLHMGVFVATVPAGLMAGQSGGSILASIIVWLIGLYLGIALIAMLVRGLLRAAPTNVAIDRWLHRIPVIGKARKSMAMARFTKVFHIGVLAGLSMTEIVSMAAEASHSGMIREACGAVLVRAKEGGLLGPVLVASRPFPAAFARSYATAEEAGGLDHDLERWARLFHEEAVRGTKAVAVAVPKVCYVLILIFVVWKILGFYSGYYETLEHLGE